MPYIYDMGPTVLLPLRRKACWGFCVCVCIYTYNKMIYICIRCRPTNICRVIFFCFKHKQPSDARAALRHTPSVGKFHSRWREGRKTTPVTITFRKSTKNHQCYSRYWKCCPSDTHALSTRAVYFLLVYLLDFLPGNLTAEVVSEILQNVRICFIPFPFYTSP